MSGYTPLFSTLTSGTLCGRWPDIGLWPIILSLTDWQGIVDVTPAYISGVTGLPVDDVCACMKRFCEPDPGSRSEAQNGARLELIDSHRDWGWRVVNLQLYRDRASGSDQIRDGRNAAKVRRYKERHRRTPRDTGGPSQTPTHTADCRQEEEQEGATAPGLDLKAWEEWNSYRTATKKPIRSASRRRAQEELAKYGNRQSAVVAHSIANGYQGLFAPKNIPKPKAVQMNPDGTVAMFAGKPVEW